MVKVLVSIDDELLAKVDEAARKRHLSRSAFLSQLASREVGGRSPEQQARIELAVNRIRELAGKYGMGEGDLTDQFREERDSH
ncbi:MAG TPA: ribbon-helix-helix protein, CopG family [Dehalococcoidia bacterium]|nr:ribbon-helix-helix protein, CopG family [Dehalococcoidia bacterium]